MKFRERFLNGEIKIYPINNTYRLYGKVSDIRDELKELGAVWNKERKNYEFSNEIFAKLDDDVREKIIQIILAEKVQSKKIIENKIISKEIKLYLKDGMYSVYGRTKEIYKDLINTGFRFMNGKYKIGIDTFSCSFCEEAREVVMQTINNPPEVENEMEGDL